MKTTTTNIVIILRGDSPLEEYIQLYDSFQDDKSKVRFTPAPTSSGGWVTIGGNVIVDGIEYKINTFCVVDSLNDNEWIIQIHVTKS